jgi:hypothetical protein
MKSWAVPAAIIVAVEYAMAILIGARAGFRYSIPFDTYMIIGCAFVGAAGAVAIVIRLVAYLAQREPHPSRRLLADAHRFVPFAVGVILTSLQISVLTWLKVMLPIVSPFWADPLLVGLDQAIFRGDPWIILNSLFGWASPVIDRVYVTWAPIKFATFIILLLMPETKLKARCLISYFLMMAAVALGEYLFSSAGPVFFEDFGFGTRFRTLPIEPWVELTRHYLLVDYRHTGGEIGGGISAMPSLHVAAALWVALVARRYHRIIGYLAFAYFTLIVIGSIQLGWHYAVDAIAGIGITITAWVLAARLAVERPERTTRSGFSGVPAKSER